MLSFVLSGLGCAFAALCYAEFAAMIPLAGSAYTYAYATMGELFAWIIGWDLTLEYAMGASTVSSGWSNHFIELLNIFNIKMPLWLAYDHWTAVRTAEAMIARQMAQASDASLMPGTQAFLEKVSAITAAHSPDLVQRAHDLLAAPQIFGLEIGFNLPAFLIALVITAILVVGIQESDIISAHRTQSIVARHRRATVLLGNQMYCIAESPQNVKCAIGRPIVDDDDFFMGVVLVKHTLHRFSHETLAVVDRDNDRYERWGGHRGQCRAAG